MRIAQPPVDWDAPDSEPVDLVFLIAVPADAGKQHLKILTQPDRALMKDDFHAVLRWADSPGRVVEPVGERAG
ncbi:MAG: PTS sugar transporter subunit IIA [Corynebacterium sp.]|nr:PTS sugar transporter subunit IIA [Corynebacterium sp.]